MSYRERINEYMTGLIQVLDEINRTQVEQFLKVLSEARSNDKNIFTFGNGGSGSTASHMSCDFNKGCSCKNKKRFKIICLNDNIPTMTAYANDVDYNDIFVEQLKNFMRSGDVVIGISGSGDSENVIRAIDYAGENGAVTVGLCGFSGGRLKKKADVVVHVKVNDMQKIEDIQLVLMHIAMQILREEE